MEGKKYRIGAGMMLLILCIAGIFEIFTLIPFVGNFLGPLYWGALTWYLYKTGHGVLNWKTGIAEGLSLLGEMIPVVQSLPTIITATVIIFFISRLEDKTGLSITKIADTIKHPMPKKLTPFYKDGVRQPQKTPEVQAMKKEDEQRTNIIRPNFSPEDEDIDMAA